MNLRTLVRGEVHVGFTLIELLLVIGIIAILASIVIVAINPTRQLGQSRDAQRRSNVNALLNAIYQYSIDNNGSLPGTLSGSSSCVANSCYICKNMDTTNAAGKCGNLAAGTVAYISKFLTGSYIVGMPQDPKVVGLATNSGAITGYIVQKDSAGRITVTAPYKEVSTTPISVTR